jgi:anthranilate synthase component 1
VGYFESEGGMDSCITIRSGLEKDGKIILQAGAGIVYDSRPEREYEETCEKLRALAVSVGVEV